jgi:hypothetical protein
MTQFEHKHMRKTAACYITWPSEYLSTASCDAQQRAGLLPMILLPAAARVFCADTPACTAGRNVQMTASRVRGEFVGNI